MTVDELLAAQRETVGARRPRAGRCGACKRRQGCYRCRMCGTDRCGHCAYGVMQPDERTEPELWMTCLCGGCKPFIIC